LGISTEDRFTNHLFLIEEMEGEILGIEKELEVRSTVKEEESFFIIFCGRECNRIMGINCY